MLLHAPSALQIRSSFPRTKSPNGFPQRSQRDRARSDYSRVDGRRGPLLGTVIRREFPLDPFTAEHHIVLALYCIAMALFVALVLLAALAAEYVDEVNNGNRRNKKWYQK